MRLSDGEIFDRARRVSLNATADVDAAIAAPGAGVKIVIIGFWLNMPGGANTVTLLAGATAAGGAAIPGLPPIELADSSGIVIMPYKPLGECPANTGLSIDVASATQTTGAIHYVLAPV